MRWVLLVPVAATCCGRIGFEPLGDGPVGDGLGVVPTLVGIQFGDVASTGGPINASLVIGAVSGVQAGDLLISAIFVNENGTANPSVVPPEGWTQQLAPVQQSATSHLGEVGIYSKIAGASEPASYTFAVTYATGVTHYSTECQLGAYRGVDTTAPVDAVAQLQSPSSTTAIAPSITIPAGHTADVLIVVFALGQPATDPSTPAGMAQEEIFNDVTNGVGGVWFDQNLTTSGLTSMRVSSLVASADAIGTTIAIAP